MIGVDHIEAWRGQQVYDADGTQLGKLDDVYFDSASGTPLLIAVRSGLLGRRSNVIPIDGAVVGPDYVRVVYRKEAVDRAADAGGDGVPDAEQLSALGAAYGLAFSERIRLESAGEVEANRAEADAARRRADQLEAAAQEKLSVRDAARQRADGATDDATQAEREAESAREAALEARRQADRYGAG
jgi:sporulation protein YlmC with PRC-barrel domain